MPKSKTITKVHGPQNLRTTVPEVARAIGIKAGDYLEWRVVGKKELRLIVLEEDDKSKSAQ